ncbi:MAG: pilus assembly protein TadG-related protein [Pseudomonadota bacterium]
MRFLTGGRRFARNRRGASAVVFALCFTPMILMAGFAIDFGLHLTYKKKVQHALDMAGLAAARHLNQDMGADLDTIKTMVRGHFQSTLADADYISLNEVDVTRAGMRINLEVDGTMPTSFMHLGGVPTMSLFTESEAVYGVPSKAEIALVLDASNSMTNTDPGDSESRLESLRSAVGTMVTELIDPDSAVEIKMAIVPFSNHVNVGMDQDGASWLAVPADLPLTETNCHIKHSWYVTNCERDTKSCGTDNVEDTCGTWECGEKEATADDWACTVSTLEWEWHGCVQPRTDTNHLQAGNYSAEQIPGILSLDPRRCATPIQPMTDVADDLNTAIAGLAARSETYIPTGLIWGLRMLTETAPFPAENSISEYMSQGGIKSIILMSDGENTLVPDATGEVLDDGDNPAIANANTRAICDTIKQAGVEIYVVAYNIADAATSAILEDCASSESRFYPATSTDQLKQVFVAISQQLGRDVSISG